MPNESAHQVALATSKAYLEAPAGFGKTETIADAVSLCNGKQLILTHTHAGVDSLRKRLRAKGVTSKLYRLDTILAWCLRFVSAYPTASGYSLTDEPDWPKVSEAMSVLMKVSAIQQIIAAAYSGVIVDEYQDCTVEQHRIIEQLANVLPVRVVGDPLQGIFNFRGQTLVDWPRDVYPAYTQISGLTQAWRWTKHNEQLGNWLIDTRERLKNGQDPDFSSTAVTYVEAQGDQAKRDAIRAVRPAGEETLVVLVRFPNEAHSLAQSLPGFVSMEEIECKDLLSTCKDWEDKCGAELLLAIIAFVGHCFTQPRQSLNTVKTRLESNNFGNLGRLVPNVLTVKLEQFGQSADLNCAAELCLILSKLPGRRVFRSELFNAMLQTLRLRSKRPELSLIQCARQVRDRVSHTGRGLAKKVISRVLLVKGLEYDHVVVVLDDNFTVCEKYVALTRGRKSLTIVRVPGRRRAPATLSAEPKTQQGVLFDF